MLLHLLLLIFLIATAVLASRRLRSASPEHVRAALGRWGLYAGAAVLLWLVLTGRLHWLFALIGASLPFIQRLRQAARALQSLRRTGGQARVSRIETRHLRLTLDQNTGRLAGLILAGPHAGRRLDELSPEALSELLITYRAEDAESAALLEAYLERNPPAAGYGQQEAERRAASPSAVMSADEAYAVLGLSPGASEAEIAAAHRRLMQRLHPDRGGSTYLAAKINQAKDRLLQEANRR